MTGTTFIKDEQNATLTIERTFPAARPLVWRALTESALLDQWWAPQPWRTATVHMDFRVGGYWHYAMIGPAGERHFGRMDYLRIEPEQRYKASDVFADEHGAANESLPRQNMTLSLHARGNATQVVTLVEYASLDDMNRIIEMGMQEGIAMAQDQLETLLRQWAAK